MKPTYEEFKKRVKDIYRFPETMKYFTTYPFNYYSLNHLYDYYVDKNSNDKETAESRYEIFLRIYYKYLKDPIDISLYSIIYDNKQYDFNKLYYDGKLKNISTSVIYNKDEKEAELSKWIDSNRELKILKLKQKLKKEKNV